MWQTISNTVFVCKFVLCPECMYSVLCWGENDYVYLLFVLFANFESMLVMFYVYNKN